MKTIYIPKSGDSKPLRAKEYRSWAKTHYSPKGTIGFQFTMGDIYIKSKNRNIFLDKLLLQDNSLDKKEIKKWITDKEPVLSVTCKMTNNKFHDLEVTFHKYEHAIDISSEDIYETMWLCATSIFEYDITNILPILMWKSQLQQAFMLEMERDIKGELPLKHIQNVLLATEYLQYCNYPMSESTAHFLISQPTIFGSRFSGSSTEIDKKAYQNVRTALSRIPKEIYIPNTQGAKGGELTSLGQVILYQYLEFNNLSKEKLQNVFIHDYGINS